MPFLQRYRLEGWHLERTVHDVGRVGLDHVKRKVLEDAGSRKAWSAPEQFGLDGEPDPWCDLDQVPVDPGRFEKVPA